MPGALLVFVGGGVGALLRYLTALLVGGPLAVLTVNIAGSFAIGLLAGAVPAEAGNVRLFFMTGVLGGFTTFSAFSLDALSIWQRGEIMAATAYVAASIILAVGAAAFGLMLGRAM